MPFFVRSLGMVQIAKSSVTFPSHARHFAATLQSMGLVPVRQDRRPPTQPLLIGEGTTSSELSSSRMACRAKRLRVSFEATFPRPAVYSGINYAP